MRIKDNIVELKINIYTERENIIKALANSGYKVWVKEMKRDMYGEDYFVCFEIKPIKQDED